MSPLSPDRGLKFETVTEIQMNGIAHMEKRGLLQMALLELRAELRNCEAESLGEKFNVYQGWVAPAPLHVC